MIGSVPTASKFVVSRPAAPVVARCVCVRAEEEPASVAESTASTSKTVKAPVEAPILSAEDAKSALITAEPNLQQRIYKTLAPRVSELRGKQLSAGLSNPFDAFVVNGPLPELLNGRLAMLGFLSCMGAEFVSHETLVKQLSDAPLAILGTFAVIAVASLIPIVRGTKVLDDGAGEGVFKLGTFNVTNELINGRAAMLGFLIVCLYETAAGGPLFNIGQGVAAAAF